VHRVCVCVPCMYVSCVRRLCVYVCVCMHMNSFVKPLAFRRSGHMVPCSPMYLSSHTCVCARRFCMCTAATSRAEECQIDVNNIQAAVRFCAFLREMCVRLEVCVCVCVLFWYVPVFCCGYHMLRVRYSFVHMLYPCMYICVYASVCMCIPVCAHVCVCVRMCVCVSLCVCILVCANLQLNESELRVEDQKAEHLVRHSYVDHC